MATIYITSNGDSGAGTLRQALTDASDGDIIALDPTVFTSGPVVIPVSSVLITANKNLTFDGGELGVILDGQQANLACISLTVGSPTVTLLNFTIKGFNRNVNGPIFINSSGAVLNLHRCKIVDNQNNYFGAIYVLAGTVNLYDSLVTGNNSKQNNSTYAGGIRLGDNGYLNLVRSTVVFNTIANVYGSASRQTRVNSFIGFNPYNGDDESLGNIEYVNPPEGAYIPFGDWVEGLWQNYDFRLKPTSPYLTGAAYQSGDLDLLGHARTGSWGAYDGSWLVASSSLTVSQSTFCDWLDIAAGATVTMTGDVVVKVTRGASIGAATISAGSSSWGLISVPAGTVSVATLSRVNVVESSAGILTASATTTSVSWTATDASLPIVIQRAVNGVYETVAQTASRPYSATLTAGTVIRLYDGANFLNVTVQDSSVALTFHPYLYYDQTVTVDTAPVYDIVTGYILMSDYYNAGETPLLMARVVDSSTGSIVDPTTVTGIKYTCYKRTYAWSQQTLTPVEGHEDVDVDLSAMLTALVTNDPRWTKDTSGYNFIFEPDSRTNPLFPDAGAYVIVVTVSFSSANPAPITYEITVN